MDSKTDSPQHAYSLDHNVVLTLGAGGCYYPDPDLLPDEAWLVQLRKAGLLPGTMKPLETLPPGSDLRLVVLGADVEPLRHAWTDRLGGTSGGGGGIAGGVLAGAIWDGVKGVIKEITKGDGKPRPNPRPPVRDPRQGNVA
ncbi:hypothetical protein ACFWUZ_32015 [Streptomyces sp. NPDC058646]|uniref:hypothetical protein n=1 Tax=Streptomyces sp. NPDC058646 TaxID=3346574 RepID=UPI003648581F